jgi:uncharacterized Zn-finger protein
LSFKKSLQALRNFEPRYIVEFVKEKMFSILSASGKLFVQHDLTFNKIENEIKREPSIDIETVEIEMFDESEMIVQGIETSDNRSVSYNRMHGNTGEEKEKSPEATAENSLQKEVPVSVKNKKASTKPICPICNKAFSRKKNLRNHLESIHEKKTRFTCAHCSKAFFRKDLLQAHIVQRHIFTNDDTTNLNRPFRCNIDICGKFFKTKIVLKV